jgi:hypothetical protein
MNQSIPEGYKQNAKGHLVPIEKIKPIDLLRDDLILELVTQAKAARKQLRDYKVQAHADIGSFVELSAEQYNTHIGGEKGNVQLVSYDGRYKIVRAIDELIVFDERLQAAKSLIDTCLKEWTEGARAEVVTLIQDAFRVDQTGNIRTGSVLALRRLKITDPRWREAMDAIGDAVQIVGSKSYIRVYERDANGKFQPISLDLAGV